MNDEPVSRTPTDALPVPRLEDIKLAALLGLLGALSTAALFPYLLVAMPQLFAKLPTGTPLWALIIPQVLQAGVLLSLLSFFGLRMGHRVGLDAPWLRAHLSGRQRQRQPWLVAVALGLSTGMLIAGLDAMFAPYMPAPLLPQAPAGAQASAVVGLLASFYGGIAEELQMRLFVMTLLVWALSALAGARPPRALHFWIAIVVAALLFGAGHLPAAAQIWPLNALVLTRIIVLNGIAGLVLGRLYWKHGLESAMLAHFSADLVLHVIAPLAFR